MPRSQRLTLPAVVPSWSATSSCDQWRRIRSALSRCLEKTCMVVFITTLLSPVARSTEHRCVIQSLFLLSCHQARGEQNEPLLYENIPLHCSLNATHAHRAP